MKKKCLKRNVKLKNRKKNYNEEKMVKSKECKNKKKRIKTKKNV